MRPAALTSCGAAVDCLSVCGGEGAIAVRAKNERRRGRAGTKNGACEVRGFRARGLYPSLRRVLGSLSDRERRDPAAPVPPGQAATVVECEVSDGDRTRSIELPVRDDDLLVLHYSDRQTALRHLSLILRAEQGDGASRKELHSRFRERLRKLQDRLHDLEQRDDRYLVLSASRQEYSWETLSHKGSTLLRLSQLGYPVPDFAILTAAAYPESRRLERHVTRAVEALEKLVGRKLGAPTEPLVLAIRCAQPQYYPGLLPTYLNVGVTESTLSGLERLFGRRAAYRM